MDREHVDRLHDDADWRAAYLAALAEAEAVGHPPLHAAGVAIEKADAIVDAAAEEAERQAAAVADLIARDAAAQAQAQAPAEAAPPDPQQDASAAWGRVLANLGRARDPARGDATGNATGRA